MTEQTIKPIALENLIVDIFNPRYLPQPSQRDALATIAHGQGQKLANLADDIVEKGLNPSELPLVAPADQKDMYVVLEGNRRIAALKLIASPQLLASIGLPKRLNERFRALHRDAQGNLPTEINCAVLAREDANHWIQLKHTGENEGVGIVTWDGRARQRFRGSSPALQAIELVEKSDYLDEETKKNLQKIYITNVERLLGTPEARKALGVDVKKNQLVIVGLEEEALGRLAIVIGEIANKRIKVSDLDSKDQRVTYAQRVAAMPLPALQSATNKGGSAGACGIKPGSSRRINPDRKTLIPRAFKLTITHPRLNRIYHELQKISVDSYVNCCSVMLRVFMEMSVGHYAQSNKLPLEVQPKAKAGKPAPKAREMTLREKIAFITKHMADNGICSKDQLRGIRSLIANREHVLSVDSLNAYVHNKDYSPTATDLKANWDSIQPFVQGLWAI